MRNNLVVPYLRTRVYVGDNVRAVAFLSYGSSIGKILTPRDDLL